MNNYIKKRTSNTMARNFFAVYFCVITIVFVWSLFNCTEYSWKSADAFLTSDDKMDVSGETGILRELKDDAPVEVTVSENPLSNEKKLRLRGVALMGYENIHSLLFYDETIQASVIDAQTKKTVCDGSMLLKHQTQYPNDETMIYIALSKPVDHLSPQNLKVRFSSIGLTRNGIGLCGEKNTDEEANRPVARLFFEEKVWNPIVPLLYFLVEAAAGLGCLLLYGEKKLPLFRRIKKSESRQNLYEIGKQTETGRKNIHLPVITIREIAILAVLIVFLLFLMLFTYLRVIVQVAGSSKADVLTGGTLIDETVAIEPGTSLRQLVTAGDNDFAGVGIRLTDEEGSAISADEAGAYAETVLEWKIFDETGTAELTGGSSSIKELKKVTSTMEKDIEDENILTAAGESVLLPLDSPQRVSRGKQYVLEISVPLTGEEQKTVYMRAVSDTNGQVEVLSDGQNTIPFEVCLMGTYMCNSFIKGMFVRLCIALIVILTGLFFAVRFIPFHSGTQEKEGAGQTARMYLISALCMGLVFSFITPVHTISDERTHIDSVYVLSNRLLGSKDIPGPRRLLKRSCDIDSSIANTMPVTAERYRVVEENLFGEAPKSEYTAAFTRNALNNVPVLCYLPGALGFTTARLLGRNLITMIIMARWLNLLASVLIIYMALCRMPYGATAMAVISLFPKTLQQMASCSYDGMIIAGTYLFIALCLAAAFDREISITDLLGLLLSGVFVASCKGGAYLPILGMVILIPFARSAFFPAAGKKNGMRWNTVSISVICCSLFVFVGKYLVRLAEMFGRASGSISISAGTKTLYTLSDFIHAPMKLVRIYLNTIYVRMDGLIGELVGKNLSQKWYIVYMFLALAILGILRRNSERRHDEAGNHLRLTGRLWIMLIVILSAALVFLSMLIGFTSRDMGYIDGLQGRYFLPLAPLPLLAFENGIIHRNGISDMAILFAADVLLAVTFLEIILFYLR